MNDTPRRPIIGLISETSFANFPGRLIEGATAAARQHGASILRFTLEPTFYENFYRDQLAFYFKTIARLGIDGLLFLGWYAEIAHDPARFMETARSLGNGAPLPLLCIGSIFRDVPSVYVDGKTYLRELLTHLVDTHHKQRIVFIKPYSTDDRYPAYERFMRERNLFRPELVIERRDLLVENDYYAQKRAAKICDLLLGPGSMPWDAVISPFSHEAAAVVEEAVRRGYTVPDDFAVVSLEDGERCRYAAPPLTAVSFPFYEIGRMACQAMIRHLEGETLPPVTYCPTTIHYRRSCGCGPEDIFPLMAPHTTVLSDANQHRPFVVHDPDDAVLSLLQEAIATGTAEAERTLMASVIERLEDAPDTEHLLAVINQLQRELLAVHHRLHADAASRTRSATLIEKILLLFRQKTELALGLNEALQYGTSQLQQEINQHIVTTFDPELLLTVGTESLERLGIQNCLIFSSNDQSHSGTDDRLIFCLHNGRPRDPSGIPLHGSEDRMKLLSLDGGLPHVYYFYLLHVRQELIGYLIIEPTVIDERAYYTLSVQLGSALHESRTLSRLHNANQGLEEARAKIADHVELIERQSKELAAANHKLSELDGLKNNFIANITREFRSPLMIILNLVDLSVKYFNRLNETTLTERLHTVLGEAYRLKNTIDRLLDIARMDATNLSVSRQPLPLRTYMANLADFYRSAVSDSAIRIISELPEKEIEGFSSDTEKLDDILNNLLVNAIGSVDQVTGVITLSVTDTPEAVTVAVTDNGRGFSPEDREALFDRFTPTGAAGSPAVAHNVRIGLAYTRQLARLLSAELTADSPGPGQGARFALVFNKPFPEREEEMKVPASGGGRMLNEKRSYYQKLIALELKTAPEPIGLRVQIHDPPAKDDAVPRRALFLIIDPRPQAVEIIKEYLIQAGYVNFLLTSGEEDIKEALKRYLPDLIIADESVSLPEHLSTPDSAMTVRQAPTPPLLILSGSERRRRFGKDGQAVMLSKPLEEDAFLSTVARLLRAHFENKALAARSVRDPTGVFLSTEALMNSLAELLSSRVPRPLGLAMLEIEVFPGDVPEPGTTAALLEEVGRRLMTVLRHTDKLGFLTKHRLCVILPE
ncbi:MAG TPA: hypothetical protein ENN69_07435, partial [Spirochaetia bacterium]|nr:hypothetical protein [Spirochaetia bacterium]